MSTDPVPLDGRLEDLKSEISEVCGQFPNLTQQGRFCAWFLLAYLVDREEDAAKSLTGAPNDKDVDAVWLDDASERVRGAEGSGTRGITWRWRTLLR